MVQLNKLVGVREGIVTVASSAKNRVVSYMYFSFLILNYTLQC
jgi:hypothetical protein